MGRRKPHIISEIRWYDFKQDGPPSDSRQVLITDGKQLGTAHFFNVVYNPPDFDKAEALNQFVNQHLRLIGTCMKTENVTHWAEMRDIGLPRSKATRRKKST